MKRLFFIVITLVSLSTSLEGQNLSPKEIDSFKKRIDEYKAFNDKIESNPAYRAELNKIFEDVSRYALQYDRLGLKKKTFYDTATAARAYMKNSYPELSQSETTYLSPKIEKELKKHRKKEIVRSESESTAPRSLREEVLIKNLIKRQQELRSISAPLPQEPLFIAPNNPREEDQEAEQLPEPPPLQAATPQTIFRPIARLPDIPEFTLD